MNSGPRVLRSGESEGARGAVWFFLITAGWWILMGLAILFAALDETNLEHERLLKRPDVVFGFSTKITLLLTGGFHLVFGPLFLCFRDSTTKVLLLFWGCSVCGIYRLGLYWLAPGWAKPGDSPPMVQLSAEWLGINLKTFGVLWGLSLVGMVVGAFRVLFIERRRRKQVAEDVMIEQWRQSHNGKGQFPWAG